MNHLKLGVFVAGVVGLVGCFLPISAAGDSVWDTHDADLANVIMMLAGFGVPILLGALAIAKPPFARWQALGALVAFALVAVKIRSALPFDIFTAGEIGWKVIGGGLYLGIVTSLLGLARPERAR